jgi:hypothetical protein
MTRTDELLHMIKAYPDLADPVLGTENPALMMTHRGHDEIHSCMACGNQANAAIIAHTPTGGDRFIDVCWACYNEIQLGTVFL